LPQACAKAPNIVDIWGQWGGEGRGAPGLGGGVNASEAPRSFISNTTFFPLSVGGPQ